MIGRRAWLLATGTASLLRPSLARADDAGADAGASDDFLLRQGGSPQNLATPLAYFDRLITPTSVFFVRSHFGPPALDRTRKTTFDGLVKTPLVLGIDELRASFPEVTVTALLQCAGNARALHRPRVPGVQWGHGAMGQATFTGVRLRDVLTKMGLTKEAQHLRIVGADAPPKPTVPAFIRSLPLERAMDPTTILAYRMNGEELTLAHGAPLRLVVPGWAGDHWVKWLVGVRAQKEEMDGFYMKTAYRMPSEPVEPGAAVPPEKMRPATTFPVKSVIARPGEGKRPVGPQEVVGLAFSGLAPIASVEVSLDEGKTFAPAKLEGEPGVGRAQVFRFRFDKKEPGRVRAIVRAKDRKGNEQPESPSWNPSGYFWNGWHSIAWEVGS
jgi:DMSO/TMAO reductase YedYZ molybdopterin-dependent catalytic subunit